MLDVLHALYEEEAVPLYEEHQKIRSNVRMSMWRQLYEKDYPFPYNETASTSTIPAGGLPPEESLLPPENAPRETKPYIPPTDPDKLASILDAPLG